MLKRNSFKFRLVALVVTLVLVTSLVVDIVGVTLIYRVSVDDASQLVQKIEGENVNAANGILENVESSTMTLYNYIVMSLADGRINLEDDTQRAEHLWDARLLALNVVENTSGAISVFYRFDKYVSYAKDGVYLGLSGKDFVDYKPVPVDRYEPTDDEVAWYYKTIAAGKAAWIEPFYEHELQRNVIAFCVPIYIDGVFIGLVGMDVDLDVLRDAIADVSVYQTGYGFLLESDGDVVYHPSYPEGATLDTVDSEYQDVITALDSNHYVVRTQIIQRMGERVWVTYQTLNNDMILGTVIRQSEILAPISQFFLRAVLFSLAVVILAVVTAYLMIQSMTKPLNELTKVAEEVAEGNMQVSISVDSDDEFGKLAKAFRSMRDEIVKSFAYMNGLAYSDMMTGVNNKGAFERDAEGITQTCLRHKETFAVVVVDINDLKTINDTLGHIIGDELIKGIAFELVKVFGKRNTYRTGGDEFCVLVRGTTEKEILENIAHFEEGVRDFSNQNESMFHQVVSSAVGYSFFDPLKDSDFIDAYTRADDYMYKKKLSMKDAKANQTSEDD